MALRKYGKGEILKEEEDAKTTAAANWTEEDSAELAQENEEADQDQD